MKLYTQIPPSPLTSSVPNTTMDTQKTGKQGRIYYQASCTDLKLCLDLSTSQKRQSRLVLTCRCIGVHKFPQGEAKISIQFSVSISF